MKILLTRSMMPEDIKYIKGKLNEEVVGRYELVVPNAFTEENISFEAVDADILLGPYVTKKILENAKQLKLIQVPWTGLDTFDFSVVKNIDIPICNTHSNADAVAEIGVTMVLDLLKKVSYHDRKMRMGNWNRDQNPLSLKSKMLNEQTVCILGFGSIGSRIGKIMVAFDANVIAVDQYNSSSTTNIRIHPTENVVDIVSNADIIICTLPLTESTRGIINDDLFSVMKDDVILVNLSRAEIIDEDAVWKALETGKLGAFGSDVWWNAPGRGETESYPSAVHHFWELDNVLMSPHRAGFVEGCLPHLDGAIQNIIAMIKGKELVGIVNIERGF